MAQISEKLIFDKASAADVAIVKTVSPSPVVPTGTLTYTLEITNYGPDMAGDVTITDIIPAEVLNPVYSLDSGVTFNPWMNSVNIGGLGLNATQIIIITGEVDGNTPTGTIENTTTVTSGKPDPNISNNTSTIAVDVCPAADIAIEKTANPTTVYPGNVLTYSLVVRNFGPNIATNVVTSDAINALVNPQYSVDGVPQGAWMGSHSIEVIPVTGEHRITITGIVNECALDTISNTTTILASTPDPDLSNNASVVNVKVKPIADVLM